MAQDREFGEDGVQEEAEPRAFSAAERPDAVHAVVPIAGPDERQSVGADREALVDRAHTVFEDGPIQRRDAGQAVRLVRANREHRRFQIGHALVQDAGVACRADVFGDHEGQPERSSEHSERRPRPLGSCHQC